MGGKRLCGCTLPGSQRSGSHRPRLSTGACSPGSSSDSTTYRLVVLHTPHAATPQNRDNGRNRNTHLRVFMTATEANPYNSIWQMPEGKCHLLLNYSEDHRESRMHTTEIHVTKVPLDSLQERALINGSPSCEGDQHLIYTR